MRKFEIDEVFMFVDHTGDFFHVDFDMLDIELI